MAALITKITQVFNWFFIGNPSATPAVAPAITTVINLIVNNDFLLVGLALMVSGAAVSYLSRLIRT